MTLSEGTVADHVAARDLVVALLEGQEDVLFKARRESRRSIYVVLKVAEADAEPVLQKLRRAATVKVLDSGAFTARAQNDEALKRKREQQDEALRATDSTLVGRLLALRGEGGDMKSRWNLSINVPVLSVSWIHRHEEVKLMVLSLPRGVDFYLAHRRMFEGPQVFLKKA
ncbi:unnamed protein product [Symbiodinium sp. KB8]|nr:unnamed protein product [Symbiodinium sp. KB8]